MNKLDGTNFDSNQKWQGYDNVKLSKRGLRIAQIISLEHDVSEIHFNELKNGLVIVDFTNYGLVGSNLFKQIYTELGMIVQALEPLDGKTRIWLGDRSFNHTGYNIHPIHKPKLGDTN